MRIVWVGDYRVDLATGEVAGPGGATRLRPLEVRLLEVLAHAAPEPVPREVIEREVWGHAPGVRSRTLSTTAARLRKQLDPACIQTVHGVGLRLVSVDPPPPDAVVAGVAEAQRCLGRGHRLVVLTGATGLRRQVAAHLAVHLGAIEARGTLPELGPVVWYQAPDEAGLVLMGWLRDRADGVAVVTRDRPFGLMGEWVVEVGP